MGKRTEFARDTIEVCRNCKAEGSVYGAPRTDAATSGKSARYVADRDL